MLSKIGTQGFQGYGVPGVELDLSPGVNVIIGSSDSGKSSLIRMLKWVVENKPQGDEFRNEFLDPKELVTGWIETSEGVRVAREKAKGVNQYTYTTPGTEPVILEALRADVPEQIKDLLRLGETNIQSQHPNDQYFMLTLTPGKVAKKLNEVAGLEVMDNAISKINSMSREKNAELTVKIKDLGTTDFNLHKLEWVPEALKVLEDLLFKEEQIKAHEKLFNEVDSLLEALDLGEQLLSSYSTIDTAFIQYDSLWNKLNEFQKEEEAYEELIDIVETLAKINRELSLYTQLPTALDVLKYIEKELQAYEADIAQYNDLIDHTQELTQLALAQANLNIQIIESEEKLQSMLEICPLCGRS